MERNVQQRCLRVGENFNAPSTLLLWLHGAYRWRFFLMNATSDWCGMDEETQP